MSKPIDKLQLAHFRGATGSFELPFDPTKNMTMLFGENGSGKSTILDAIDVVCNSTIGTLGDISVGRNPGQYLCSVGSDPEDLTASISSGEAIWTGTLRQHSIHVSGDGAKPTVKILRRHKILDLILAEPRKRYDALKNFIDIPVVEQSEQTLRAETRRTSERITSLTADRVRQEDQLNEVWVREGKPGPGDSAHDWAAAKVELGIDELNAQLDTLNSVIARIKPASDAKRDYSRGIVDNETALESIAAVDEEIKKLPAIDPATAIQLIGSLNSAKDYIEAATELKDCPTCLRPMPRDNLLTIVNDQLQEMSELNEIGRRRMLALRESEVATANSDRAIEKLQTSLKALEEELEARSIPEVDALAIEWPDWDAVPTDPDLMIGIGGKFEEVEGSLQTRQTSVQRDVSQFNSIQEWYQGIQDATSESENLDRIHSGLQRAYEMMHSRRIAFVQNVLNDIRDEANRLFGVIHPGENIGLSELMMDESRQGSVVQKGQFHGHMDAPPQAVFSESHMDTLGFCVWLALAKREKPEETVLVLDDIFTSVDSQHLGRIIDLLHDEGENFLQMIVATHYRLWWDRCQAAQGVERVHLGKWDRVNGIVAKGTPLITQELGVLIDNPILDRQGGASKAGILLEATLDRLTIVYRRSVPRTHDDQHTLGELISGCKKLFSRHNLSVERDKNWNKDGASPEWEPSDTATPFTAISELNFIRNQVGCHFNCPGMDIPDDEVRKFGCATIDLVNALVCPNCGFIASKPTTDGTALRCSCPTQTIRMTPVTVS